MPTDEDVKRQVKVYLLASVQDKLKSLAEARKTSMSAVVADLVMKAARRTRTGEQTDD